MKTNHFQHVALGAIPLASMMLAAPVQAANSPAKDADKPNIILLVADDLGYGDLSCYGATEIKTPHIDAVAANGVRFTDAHTVAATSTPSRYSLFTGMYSWRRRDTGIARGDAKMIIRPEQYTIADVMGQAGYHTAAIGKWHLGLGDKTGAQNWNTTVTPNAGDIGFQYSYLMAATADRTPCVFIENGAVANYDASAPIFVSYKKNFPGEPTGKQNPELLYNLKYSHDHNQSIVNGISRIGYMKGGGKALWKDENINDTIVDRAKQFMRANQNHPFFLYVGTNDVHVPRFPHQRFVGKSGMGLRGDAILQFDWTVQTLMEELESLGIADNTMIIITSDNGPVLDDGYQDQAEELLGDHTPWGPLRGGKYSNFEAGTRVPFIVNWPGGIKKGKVSKALVSQIDVYASLTKLVGGVIPEGAATDSQDQLKSLLGKDKKGRDYVIESAGSLSVSDGEWKYIKPNKKRPFNKAKNIEMGNNKVDQLYHIKKDIHEKKNVADKYPKRVQKLQAILAEEINK